MSETDVSCDIEMEKPMIPVFPDSSKPCVEVWNDKLKKGILSCTHFKEHWRIWVPKIYSPEPNGSCLDWSFDEAKAQEVLFDTLEQFICNGDPQEVLTKLSQLDSPPSVCGRVFKMGEPTYSCRECGMDSTCVLCVDCFKQSAHRHHKYKMGTSSGGGCCDCGDTEAWRTEPFCDIHLVGSETRPDSSGKRLPDDLSDRARATFTAVLKYAYQLLTLEHSPGLPSDLRVRESDEDPLGFLDTPDTYCTVLFNDETHTFEQVSIFLLCFYFFFIFFPPYFSFLSFFSIFSYLFFPFSFFLFFFHSYRMVITTLARVIKCTQRDAIEYVTNIDREGRAVVKCSTFQHCNELKTEIERFTARHGNRPLKVLVVHAHVVAHQYYAMKLLDWLQKILAYAEGFRVLFSEVALQTKSPDASIVEGILLRDSHLWKSARTHWHRLIISGMLMEYDSKKAFAKVFTKNYGSVVKDFMRDDHDHSFSIASMSVQVFTVPTLAHHLIANEDVLFILLNTFISECKRKCNKSEKLEFERNASSGTFKRAQYILYDLRYLLSAKPTNWTDALRKGFLQGVSLLLTLLTYMQGMDLVTRQVGQHMEYEPEWESAFNLHIKLAHVITLALEWCGTDRVVLIKAYRATLKKLYDDPSFDPSQVGEVRELADHSATCVQYDVGTQPVSIHLPLSRFLAGLHLYLEKFGLNFDSHELQVSPRPTPEQLIEPVLRTQVMISQVHAGMWRRNGYSLLNQLYFYQNVKCRSEMLDRDIVLLQIGASLIESNEFLIHLLNKFNLMNWANSQFELNTLKNPEEDSMRQTISLVEEFLGLLIVLVGERYTPGVGKISSDDRIKKELIQQLCIKSMPHSELNKTLPEDVNHETGMERVIDEVADFKKPTQGSGKGVYELKNELYSEYNVFFYHYTREELSKSEESQRKRRKAAKEMECCPPPPLPPLTDSFMMMANLLQCDVMLHIIHVVLERSINLRARSFSEAQLHKVLHLIGYALQEEEKQHCQFLRFTERAEKWGIEHMIEELCTSVRVEAHKDLLMWALSKYRQVAAQWRQDGPTSAAPTELVPETSQTEDTVKEKEWRAKMAAAKRAKIMAHISTLQKNFMKENAKLFETTETKESELGGSMMDLSEVLETSPIALGPNQTSKVNPERKYTCILCQEVQIVSADGPALVLAAFVQQSTVLSQCRKTESLDMEESGSDEVPDPLFLPATLGSAPHTGTCGHVMHSHCWQKYFDNVLAKENRRPYRLRQPVSFDVEKREFLCPLCECLSNTILPLVPLLGTLQPANTSQLATKNISFEAWLQGLQIALKYKKKLSNNSRQSSPRIQQENGSNASSEQNQITEFQVGEGESDTQPLQLLYYTCPVDQVSIELGESGPSFAALFPTNRDIADEPQLSENLSEMILLYSQATYTTGLGVHPHLGDSRVPLMTWKSCAYTIHALECLLRDMEKPLLGDLSSRQKDCLEGLVRIVGVLSTTWKRPGVISSHALRLLSMILENPSDGPCILDWDCFGVLVPLTLSLPSLFLSNQPTPIPTGNIQELNTLRLVFLSHIVKILITTDFTCEEELMDIEEDGGQDMPVENSIMELLNTVRKMAALTTDENATEMTSLTVWKKTISSCIPFLRCCALFYHFLTGVPSPSELMEVGGDTFENLTAYLGLPSSYHELICSPVVKDLAIKWTQHDKVRQYISGASNLTPVTLPLPVNQLVALPTDYSELINTVSLFITCPNSEHEDSRTSPTWCLGLSLSRSFERPELNKAVVGACTDHAPECGAGVGVYLRVRECEVLLLASPNRGSFKSSPYLDQYGETDQGLRRGNPLQLCPERYKKLQLLWLSHGVHEEIARGLETSSNLMTTQWQHL
ncbi:hypothetical protein L9F63_017695 [Diploptera punctata]|uniref:E3 ubiquitin-protein ligase n=1 Tax=Diploptera punctata TaxID=6984 RepID=A0AAD8EFV7_DIPPU|nr:hypothetical protein L9F63_017695 [Diploptera punctata]